MSAGPAFYDDDQIFAMYMRHRERPDTPSDTLENPVIAELIGPVAELDILDLGCGDAMFGRELLEHGAASYVGVEGSHRMAEAAEGTLAGSRGQIVRQTLEEAAFRPQPLILSSRGLCCTTSRISRRSSGRCTAPYARAVGSYSR